MMESRFAVDRRGVLRGYCKDCGVEGCDRFEILEDSNRCAYCDCPSAKHKNKGSSSGATLSSFTSTENSNEEDFGAPVSVFFPSGFETQFLGPGSPGARGASMQIPLTPVERTPAIGHDGTIPMMAFRENNANVTSPIPNNPANMPSSASMARFPFQAPSVLASKNYGIIGEDQPHPFLDEKYPITVYDYCKTSLECFETANPQDFLTTKTRPPWATVRWIHVEGIDKLPIIHALQTIYQLHPLAVEDAVAERELPKYFLFPNQLFMLLHLINIEEANDNDGKVDEYGSMEGENLQLEQLSIFVVGDGTVITIQEAKYPRSSFHSVWEPVMNRLYHPNTKVRHGDATFLMYAILDAAVDAYFPVTSHWGFQLENLELGMLKEPTQEGVSRAMGIRRHLQLLRRLLWPTSEMTSSLQKEDDAISLATKEYLTDVTDHVRLNMEMCATYIDISASITDLYSTFQASKMNDIMQHLTVVSTIFVPLSFLAGVYGMNFDVIPELKDPNGYFFFWAGCLFLVIVQCSYFWKIGWLW